MPITVNGSGTITGVSVGGLPDGIVDTDMLAADAVTDAKQNLSGAAKAWVNFNGTGTVAIRDNFNVSSITDNGTGDYTITYTTAMANANYVMTGTGSLDSRTETIVVTGYTEATRVAGSIRVNTRYDNSIATDGTNVDVSTVAVAIFGD